MFRSVETERLNEESNNIQKNPDQAEQKKLQYTANSESTFLTALFLGSALSSAFLTIASLSPEGSALQRYFLGHPKRLEHEY